MLVIRTSWPERLRLTILFSIIAWYKVLSSSKSFFDNEFRSKSEVICNLSSSFTTLSILLNSPCIASLISSWIRIVSHDIMLGSDGNENSDDSSNASRTWKAVARWRTPLILSTENVIFLSFPSWEVRSTLKKSPTSKHTAPFATTILIGSMNSLLPINIRSSMAL